jgi:glycosyltransferase involved in cell wall biosynthesis
MIPFFTIIIPVKAINNYVRETVPYIQNLSHQSWELIILPNVSELDEWNDTRIQVVPSGRVGPAKKRDMGAELAQGEILVFLDDDSYPEPNLLNIAEHYFSDSTVVALGGPAMTPPLDTFWQRVSGAVFLSKFSGGAPERYIPYGEVRDIQDWPSVNLMVRTADFLVIGGFNSPYWPGEDTKLCLDLIQKTHKRILYAPDLVVWHHRRAGLKAHLKQVGGYGLHRGYFAKRYPETSRRFMYFLPSGFLLFVIFSFFMPWLPDAIRYAFMFGWVVYGVALVFAFNDFVKSEKLGVALCALWYVPFTHMFYGVRFLQGLFTRNLVSKLR